MREKAFEIQNDLYILKPELKNIPFFKDMEDYFKEGVNKMYQYCDYMVNLSPIQNPFADYEEHAKSQQIQMFLQIEIYEEDLLIEQCMRFLEKIYATPNYRTYRSLKKLLDRYNTDIDILSEQTLNYEAGGNAQGIITIVKNLEIVKKQLKIAKNDFLEEQGETKGRGNGDFAYDEFDNDEELE